MQGNLLMGLCSYLWSLCTGKRLQRAALVGQIDKLVADGIVTAGVPAGQGSGSQARVPVLASVSLVRMQGRLSDRHTADLQQSRQAALCQTSASSTLSLVTKMGSTIWTELSAPGDQGTSAGVCQRRAACPRLAAQRLP